MFVHRTTKETLDIQGIGYFYVIFPKYIATNIQIVAQYSGGGFSYIILKIILITFCINHTVSCLSINLQINKQDSVEWRSWCVSRKNNFYIGLLGSSNTIITNTNATTDNISSFIKWQFLVHKYYISSCVQYIRGNKLGTSSEEVLKIESSLSAGKAWCRTK